MLYYYLGNGVINNRIDIPALASRTVYTDFDLDYGGAGKLIWSALTQGKIAWRMAGTAHYDTLFGTMNIQFDLMKT